MVERKVRVRFAPSPTGPLHIGGVRTALYNYLFARQHGGDFILRIEDTDRQRYVEGAEAYIHHSLAWSGLEPDEGVKQGGDFGPYRQSDRKAIYPKYVEELCASGWAYYAFDTPEELAALRREHESRGETFAYSMHNRNSLDNSLNMNESQLTQRLKQDRHWVIRFKIPAGREIIMQDMIRGEVRIQSDTLDDKVLFKNIGQLPTYHLANIVDDHLMQISHVIRGEEWLPSLPLHYLLYEAFGWQDSMPQFAHLPLILKPTGSGKLSKRDGDKMGFPVFPLAWKPTGEPPTRSYKEDGYLPEAFLNMLALLGWHPDGDKEVMTMREMIELFDITKVSKAGARFDPDKARWINHEHLQQAPEDLLAEHMQQQLAKQKVIAQTEIMHRAINCVRDRLFSLDDLWPQTDYIWLAPKTYCEKAMKKFDKPETRDILQQIRTALLNVRGTKNAEEIREVINNEISENKWSKGLVMNTLRLAIVGESRGMDIGDIIAIIGIEEARKRMKRRIDSLPFF